MSMHQFQFTIRLNKEHRRVKEQKPSMTMEKEDEEEEFIPTSISDLKSSQ